MECDEIASLLSFVVPLVTIANSGGQNSWYELFRISFKLLLRLDLSTC